MPTAQQPRLWVVSDDDAVRRVAKKVCKARRVKLTLRSSVSKAKREAQAAVPHALLVQLELRGKPGLDVAKACKEQAEDMPVVVIGHQGSLAEANAALDPYHVQGFIRLPAEEDTLRRALEALCEQASTEPTRTETGPAPSNADENAGTEEGGPELGDSEFDESLPDIPEASLEKAFKLSFDNEDESTMPPPTATARIETVSGEGESIDIPDFDDEDDGDAFAPMGSGAPMPPPSVSHGPAGLVPELDDSTDRVAKGTTTKQISTIMSEVRALSDDTEKKRKRESTFIIDFNALKEAEEQAIAEAQTNDSGAWTVDAKSQSGRHLKDGTEAPEGPPAPEPQPGDDVGGSFDSPTRSIPHLRSVALFAEADATESAPADTATAAPAAPPAPAAKEATRVEAQTPPTPDLTREWTPTPKTPEQLTEEVWGPPPTNSPHRRHMVEAEEHYVLERQLGEGKAGAVYLGRWPGETTPEAVKVLDKSLSDDPAFRQKFRREIRSQAALNHPNIVAVTRYGRKHDLFYLGMECMQTNLAQLLRPLQQEQVAVPTAVVTLVLEDLLHGIHYAHSRQVIHRDLKPSNLMVSDQGVVKIAYFGLAKSAVDPNQSTPGSKMGTAAYLSPEQAAGGSAGPRSDLFSIATVARELLTGSNPYNVGSLVDCMLAVGKAEAQNPAALSMTVHPLLGQVVQKLGAKDPKQRFPTGFEALSELQPLITAVSKRYPKLRQQFLAAPVDVAVQLVEDEAKLELKTATRLMEIDERAHCREACRRLLRAKALAPTLTEDVDAKLVILQERYDLRPGAEPSTQLASVLASLEATPHDVGLLESAVSLAREEGLVWHWSSSLMRLLEHKPSDDANRMHLVLLMGEVPAAPFAKVHGDDEDVPEKKIATDRKQRAGGGMRIQTAAANATLDQKRVR